MNPTQETYTLQNTNVNDISMDHGFGHLKVMLVQGMYSAKFKFTFLLQVQHIHTCTLLFTFDITGN